MAQPLPTAYIPIPKCKIVLKRVLLIEKKNNSTYQKFISPVVSIRYLGTSYIDTITSPSFSDAVLCFND